MKRPPRARSTAGFTLLEVMLAVIILGGALSVLYRSIIVNVRMIDISHERQEVAYVFSLGELEHPLRDIEDIEEDVPVDPVRTTVTWGGGHNREEIVRYLRKTN